MSCDELFTPGNEISDPDSGCVDAGGDRLLFAFAYATYDCQPGQVNYSDLGDRYGVWDDATGEVLAVTDDVPTSAELETWCA